jgi:multimeric flavodoxin WrbA
MMFEPPRPVILLASSRSAGNTFALARAALPEGCATLVDLARLDIGYYSYSNAHAGDDFLPLVQRLVASPVWVLATPLYWYTMSAQAKTFVDRLSDLLSSGNALGHRLRGKGLAVLCSGTDPELPASFDAPFELTCNYLGIRFLGSHYARFDGDRWAGDNAINAALAFGATLARRAADQGAEPCTGRGGPAATTHPSPP